jgi:hypothetical protein
MPRHNLFGVTVNEVHILCDHRSVKRSPAPGELAEDEGAYVG